MSVFVSSSEWYKPNSTLLNPAYYSAFLNDLYDLNDLQFDLAPTGHDLDTAWPTFARKAHGGNSFHVWNAVSRSSSISSLSSQVNRNYLSNIQESNRGQVSLTPGAFLNIAFLIG